MNFAVAEWLSVGALAISVIALLAAIRGRHQDRRHKTAERLFEIRDEYIKARQQLESTLDQTDLELEKFRGQRATLDLHFFERVKPIIDWRLGDELNRLLIITMMEMEEPKMNDVDWGAHKKEWDELFYKLECEIEKRVGELNR